MKKKVKEIGGAPGAYTINLGGNLDEFNTADYVETYGGAMRLNSLFQPNVYVLIENTGAEDVLNFKLTVNNRRGWYSADDILDRIILPGMNDAEKAMALFCFSSSIEVQAHDNNRRVGPPFPAEGDEHVNRIVSHPSKNEFKERADPVKAANCYYCSGCSLSASNFVILCRHAGIPARAVWMCPQDTFTTHCVAEAWYDGAWHLFDPERRSFYLKEDNVSVASYKDLHENPALAGRTGDGGFASSGKDSHEPEYKKFYPPHAMPVDRWLSLISLNLRPGEKILWQWKDKGKYRYGSNIRGRKELKPYQLANGKFIFRPILSGEAYLRGILWDNNIVSADVPAGSSFVHPEASSDKAGIMYKISSPYPIVGALIKAQFMLRSDSDTGRVLISVTDEDCKEVWSSSGGGAVRCSVKLDGEINAVPKDAIREYYLLFELRAGSKPENAAITKLSMETDFQASATSLPSLSTGENQIKYCSDSGSDVSCRITHCWRERSDISAPLPPVSPATPQPDETVSAQSPGKLEWENPPGIREEDISNCHVQVSGRPDMLYCVSPNLDRLTFSGKNEWVLPAGWLAGGKKYYWRVRLRNISGVWSRWSRTWEFRSI